MITHSAYPVEPWSLRETELDLKVLDQAGSVFALANGHIGLRGNLDEGEPPGLPGTYLNGSYEQHPLPYAEPGYGDHEHNTRDRGDHRPPSVSPHPRARRKSAPAATPWPHPGTPAPCNPAVAFRRFDARRNRSVSRLAARPCLKSLNTTAASGGAAPRRR